MAIYDDTLYKNVSNNVVYEPLRAMVANRLANTGSEWASLFENYNR